MTMANMADRRTVTMAMSEPSTTPYPNRPPDASPRE
jgi:hypothetical protein